jgi:ribosome maturation factor RimP
MIPSERIAELVGPVLSESGHTLYDVEVAGATVRVLVEGASLEDLEQISRSASTLLDEVIADDERWYLEVSSPGLERPLRQPRHYEGAVGSLVKIKTAPGLEGDRRVEGVLESADASGISIAGRHLGYEQIERARTVFEWGAGATVPTAPAKANKRSTT